MAAEEARERVLASVVAVAGRVGLSRMTVDEVAAEAGVSRASVYRWFPGGRDQLVDEGVTFEVARFLGRLGGAVEGAADLRACLVRGLVFAHRAIEDHEVLQRLLETEPGGLLPQLQQTVPLVIAVLRDALVPWIEAEPRRRPTVAPAEAAEWLARMFLSLLADEGRPPPRGGARRSRACRPGGGVARPRRPHLCRPPRPRRRPRRPGRRPPPPVHLRPARPCGRHRRQEGVPPCPLRTTRTPH